VPITAVEVAESLDPSPARRVACSARGLTVRFGGLNAVSAVDLDVEEGELVALAGENGAGKTTLVRCLAGDIVANSGSIELFGTSVAGDPAAVARLGVAVVWQDLALCDNLDVAANLLLGQEGGFGLLSDARLHRRAAMLLDRLKIPLADTTRSAKSLSGGQRQLLAVARAMRDLPRLVILDEPTSSLGVSEAAEVESLIAGLRADGVTIVLVTHDLEQMFRLADRIVVLRAGRVVDNLRPEFVHPDDVVALMSGQELDSSARGQLTRLHGLVDQLATADRSASLLLILSTLGAALRAGRLSIHVRAGDELECVASLGLSTSFLAAWGTLPLGPRGGPVGIAASTASVVVDEDVGSSETWSAIRNDAQRARIASSCSVPIFAGDDVLGVITVFHPLVGGASRDEIELVRLYAGYAASAFERERLFAEATARNRVLETIREVLETLAGVVPAGGGFVVALRALRDGFDADEVALICKTDDDEPRCRASTERDDLWPAEPSALVVETAIHLLGHAALDGTVQRVTRDADFHCLAVTFPTPGGRSVLVARWAAGKVPEGAVDLLADTAHSLFLALEREEAGLALQEAAALRRSHELQRGFLSRLSHELRTPLTAIRGYASSLLQPDVVWDGDSQHRFLDRIAEESARLGRLVEDLLDFSAIESGVLRLQRDWCNVPLILEAATSCLLPEDAQRIEIACDGDLPVIWADHDRLEQVFVNLLDNACRHNPPSTRVRLTAAVEKGQRVAIVVADSGPGMAAEVALAPFEPGRRRTAPTGGSGLGLSIAKAIVDAHGGEIVLEPTEVGTRFVVHLPIESSGSSGEDPSDG
jgi:signal transduction histidine kinase/ABC-type multidrug transport system ATPase subunit